MAESKTSMTEQRGRAQQNAGGEQRGRGRSLARSEAFPFAGPGASFSPFELMRRMTDEMDRMFDEFYDDFRGARRSLTSGAGWTPRVEVFQKQDRLVVRAELPGIRKEDVNVELADDVLTIQGERREEHEEEREGFYQTERSYGSFYRAIPLPEGVIAESAEASFKDGVLEITMQAPPKETSRSRRLEIKEAGQKQ